MRTGSLVETVADFEESRRTWGFPYPKKGDVLTVSRVTPHHVKEVRERGIVLLHFEELPNMVGLCDKTNDGKANFVELLFPNDMNEKIKEMLSPFQISTI